MYNEEQTIGELIERSKKYTDICVVNDGSKDKTADIVNSYPEVVQIIHQKNTHIPQTIRDGMKYAYDNNYDYVITMDAGLSHSPEELTHFLEHVGTFISSYLIHHFMTHTKMMDMDELGYFFALK